MSGPVIACRHIRRGERHDANATFVVRELCVRAWQRRQQPTVARLCVVDFARFGRLRLNCRAAVLF